jgi:branched-chain amino acid transport system permease protein
LINGLSIGSVYALITIGYNMVYGILELLNFAHGDVYALGCFVVLGLVTVGFSPVIAILAGIISGYILNVLVERFAYRPVRFSGRVTPTISAVGIAYIMRNIILKIWGPETYALDLGFRGSQIEIDGIIIGTLQIYIFAAAVFFMAAITLFMKKTKIGQGITAISQSIPTAALLGVPVNRTISIVYGMGGVLGVIGGILFCSYYDTVFVGIGFTLGTLKAWMAAIVGGVGSLKGAILGAMLLGISENMVAGYVSTLYKDAIVWLILICFILIKPQGFFPSQVAEKI